MLRVGSNAVPWASAIAIASCALLFLALPSAGLAADGEPAESTDAESTSDSDVEPAPTPEPEPAIERAEPCAHPSGNRWLSRGALAAALARCDDPKRRGSVLKRGYPGAGERNAAWLDTVRSADELLNEGGPATDSWREFLTLAAEVSLRKNFHRKLDGFLKSATGKDSEELRAYRKERARKPAPLLAHPAFKKNLDGLLQALLAPDTPAEVWWVLQAATQESMHKKTPWPEAHAELISRLAYTLLVVGWAGELSDRAVLDAVAAAFERGAPEPNPKAIAKDVLGEDRAEAVLAAMKYTPEAGAEFDPPSVPGMGVLLIYRPGGMLGAAIPVVPSVNGDVIGVLTPGKYCWVYMPPGRYRVEAKTEAIDSHEVEVVEGEIVSVRGQIVMGVMVGRPHFDQGEDIDTVLAATERWKGAPPPWMKEKYKAPAVSVR